MWLSWIARPIIFFCKCTTVLISALTRLCCIANEQIFVFIRQMAELLQRMLSYQHYSVATTIITMQRRNAPDEISHMQPWQPNRAYFEDAKTCYLQISSFKLLDIDVVEYRCQKSSTACDCGPVRLRTRSHGRSHGFESGGDNFARGASRKKFWPPTFWPVGGQNIA